MSDVFKEQIVRQYSDTKELALRISVSLAAGMISFIAINLIGVLGLFITFFVILGAYHLLSMFNREFEYIFTNGDLDIDCIYSKKKRKRVFAADSNNIEIIVPFSDNSHNKDFEKAAVVKDCSSRKNPQGTYKLLGNYKSRKFMVLFEPNESLIAAMLPYLGQRKFIKQL
ncbi:MAG: DUF6106 family protein [Clostridiales bacterium]|jgi:hypothetical protein|nr:DUF6106 family protein [Clostridiales bacterium]